MIFEPQQQYPVFYKAGSKLAWESINNQANQLLGYASDGAETYSKPIIDVDGNYWFLVNQEVSSLVELLDCVLYEEIKLPILKP